MDESNYWLSTVSAPGCNKEMELPGSVDVAIVGAGITGLSAALSLAKRGVDVAVLEAREFSWGASCRNGGMVLTGLKLPLQALISRYGCQAACRMYLASLASIDCLEDIVIKEKINCNFSRCGHLEVACKPSHFEDFAKSAEQLYSEIKHKQRLIDKDDLSNEIGSDIYFGGLVDDLSAGLNPAAYVSGLAEAAEKAGAQIHFGTAVQAIERSSGQSKTRFHLSTSNGKLAAQTVLLASGAYTTAATPALRKKIIPIGSYIVATEILPHDLALQLNPRNRMIFDSKNFLHYYRLTPDNRLLFGGRAAFFPENKNTIKQSADILRRGITRVYPQLSGRKIEYAWGGTVDLTLDIMPHAGQIGGMYYALGYAGHGVSLSTYFGVKLAEIICGQPVDLPFYNISFKDAPAGLRSGCTWALPLAELYYRFLDIIT